MRIPLILLLSALAKIALGSDCKPLTKVKEYELSDVVFVGEVVESGDDIFLVHVTELFKGQLLDTVVGVIDDQSIRPDKGELWLIYATKDVRGKIHANFCGWSRSFDRPFSLQSKSVPPPPSPESSPQDLQIINMLAFQDIRAELHNDVLDLRMMILQKELRESKSKTTQLEDSINQFIASIIIVVICVLSLLLGGLLLIKGKFSK